MGLSILHSSQKLTFGGNDLKGHMTSPRGRHCVSEMKYSEIFIWERRAHRVAAGGFRGLWMELCQARLLLSENWCHSVLGGAAVWSGAGVAVHRPPGDGE